MMLHLRPKLASVLLATFAQRERHRAPSSAARLIAALIMALLIAAPAQAGEPDESGIGGTGHTDTLHGDRGFERPEMPDRIERIEPFEAPERPDFSSAPELPTPPSDAGVPPGDIGVPGSIPTAPASGSQ